MEIKSPYSNVDIPDVSLGEFMLSHIIQYGSRPCLIDDDTGRVVSYAQFVSDCYKFAAGMYSRGLRPGDKVAVCAPNCIQYPVIFYGMQLCRATFVGMVHVWTIYQCQFMYEDTKPDFIITTPKWLPNAIQASKECTEIKEIIILGDQITDDYVTFKDIMDNCFEMPVLEYFPKDDIATITFTSGSTGRRKGAKKTHYNLVASALGIYGTRRKLWPKSDTGITALTRTFTHNWAHCEHFLFGLYAGVTGVIISNAHEINSLIDAVDKYKINSLICTALDLLEILIYQAGSKDDRLTSIESVNCSGMRMINGLPEKAFASLKNLEYIYTTLGMTEADSVIIEEITQENLHKGGCLFPNITAKIMEPETLKSLGPGEKGELWLKSPCVIQGYINRPDATAEAFHDGWLRTGDVLYYDENNRFFVVDRIKHMIKYAEIPISPAEIEAVIMKLSSVVEVAVVGIPDSVYGELPKAFVAKKPGADLTEDQVKDFVLDHLPVHHSLHGGVQFVDSLPKSEIGKILKTEIKAQYCAGHVHENKIWQ